MNNINDIRKDIIKYVINSIKNVIKIHGELNIEDFDMDILFNVVFKTELSKYNYKLVKEIGCIKLSNGNKIVQLLENGCMIKQDGIGEDYDLVIMAYEDLSDKILWDILFYLTEVAL